MNVDLRYLGRSDVSASGTTASVRFAPNLARPKVFFDAEISRPLRYREAMSALHAVVVGDLRRPKKDRTAWLEWKKDEERKEQQASKDIYDQKREAETARLGQQGPPPDLEERFHAMHRLYWSRRVQWANELQRHDPELFRHLVPCDPVVTVAPDAVLFECFAKDESSYGCLSVDRAAFRAEAGAAPGTTNVDYSIALYEHFQTLRTYRATRMLVDPSGFEVNVEGREDYREEKIDLPPSWLRGFGQIQAAMGLPSRRVELPVEAVYSILAYLRRHREKTGPRSMRFQLVPGRVPTLTLDPWGVAIPCRGAPFEGDRPEEIKVWGRRRLMALARVLPLTDRVEVAMLGSGMPSIWVAHMGEMRFTLALSGWTANDWTSSTNLDLLAGNYRTDARVIDVVSDYLRDAKRASLAALTDIADAPRDVVLGSLHQLAKQGQLIYDFGGQCYRWRQVMPVVLSEAVLGPENPELTEGRRAWRENRVKIAREETLAGGRVLLVGTVDNTTCEAMLSADDLFTRAKCTCRVFHKNKLRGGPCRHLLALRMAARGPAPRANTVKS